MRAIAGILAGVLIGLLITIVVAVVAIGVTGGAPAGSEPVALSDSQRVLEIFAELPVGAKLGFLFAWFAGALAGASVAKLIARQGWAAWTVAGVIAAYVLLNVMILAMPGWMQALAVAAPLFGGLIGNHLVKARTDVETSGEAAATTDA